MASPNLTFPNRALWKSLFKQIDADAAKNRDALVAKWNKLLLSKETNVTVPNEVIDELRKRAKL